MDGRSGEGGRDRSCRWLADRRVSSVRLFEHAQALEGGDDARHADLSDAVGGDDDFGFGAPGAPDGWVRGAEENDTRNAEGGGDVGGAAIVSDKDGGFRDQGLRLAQGRLQDLVRAEG